MSKSLKAITEVSFIPLTEHWVPLLWPLIEQSEMDIPKSWPKTHDELVTWALGTRKQQTIADRSIILIEDEVQGEFLPVGLITGDLVRGINSDNFPGAKLGDVNIAYLVFGKYRGQGSATQALNQVRKAWIEDGKHPVLRIATDNLASQKVAENAGFTYVETTTISERDLKLYRSK